MPGTRTTGSPLPRSITILRTPCTVPPRTPAPCTLHLAPSSVPERLPRLQRMLDALERLAFAQQAEERLTLKVEQVLLAHRRRVGQRAAAEDVRQLVPDQ